MSSNNTLIKEYFADMAGVSPQTLTFNTCIRKGLEAAGYTGSLNKMLRDWAIDTAGAGTSINTAFRLALIDLGGEGYSINTLIGSALDNTETWATQAAKWEDEDRLWNYIN